jgi:hypothetical protein
VLEQRLGARVEDCPAVGDGAGGPRGLRGVGAAHGAVDVAFAGARHAPDDGARRRVGDRERLAADRLERAVDEGAALERGLDGHQPRPPTTTDLSST